jgi:hypothetical protein
MYCRKKQVLCSTVFNLKYIIVIIVNTFSCIVKMAKHSLQRHPLVAMLITNSSQ